MYGQYSHNLKLKGIIFESAKNQKVSKILLLDILLALV